MITITETKQVQSQKHCSARFIDRIQPHGSE